MEKAANEVIQPFLIGITASVSVCPGRHDNDTGRMIQQLFIGIAVSVFPSCHGNDTGRMIQQLFIGITVSVSMFPGCHGYDSEEVWKRQQMR